MRLYKGAKSEYVILLFLLQTVLLLLTVEILSLDGLNLVGYVLPRDSDILPLMLFVGGICGLIAMILAKEIFVLMKKETEADYNNLMLQNFQEINQLLRAERHDFQNHLQVISGFVQLRNWDEATKYIKEINRDMFSNCRGQLDYELDPALNMLLAAKAAKAKEIGIEFIVQNVQLLSESVMRTIDLVRVLGNLLDNALYETEKRGRVTLTVQISKELIIEVTNTGPPIPASIRKKIFNPGFTTKGTKGTGMGLHIVKTLAEKYGGNVRVSSNCEETSFQVIVPTQTLKGN